MAKIYLLTIGEDYCGQSPKGIFSTYEKAMIAANNVKYSFCEDSVNIYEILIDNEYQNEEDPECIYHARTKKETYES